MDVFPSFRVVLTKNLPKTSEDGAELLAVVVESERGDMILVHPDNWTRFVEELYGRREGAAG